MIEGDLWLKSTEANLNLRLNRAISQSVGTIHSHPFVRQTQRHPKLLLLILQKRYKTSKLRQI